MLLLLLSGLISLYNPDSALNRKVIIDQIKFEGNKKTKESVLYREITFKKSDTLFSGNFNEAVERSRLNLYNTNLFTFVRSEITYLDSSRVSVKYLFNEAWYTWPLPIFELVDRNINEWLISRDLRRTNYGLYLTQQNVRGRNETLNLGFKAGYTESFQIQYTFPYITRRQDHGIGFSFSYSRNHETVYGTQRNKILFFNDHENHSRQTYNYALRYLYRQGFYISHTLRLGFKQYQVLDTVIKLNQDYFPRITTSLQYPYISYQWRKDLRDVKAYPLKGYLIFFEIQKIGIGGQNSLDEWFLYSAIKKFWPLSRHFFFAAALTQNVAFVEKQSYYNQVSLGYDDFLRGFEYYVIPGQYYSLFQSNLKWNAIKTKILKLKFIPLEKFNTIPNAFFVNLFFDAGYVKDKSMAKFGPMGNTLLYSYGIGFDYFTYYSTVIRVDFSINKFGEQGFFLHFTVPI